MKILSSIENIDGRYHVQVATGGFTAHEEELLLQFGEPTIDVGSDITGSASRPGQTDTLVTITPTNGGAGAQATVTLDSDGSIASFTIVDGGSSYENGASATITGDGDNATADVVIEAGVVTELTITNAGAGYHQVPTATEYTLPPGLRRIRRDSPFIQVFDLNDYPDSDVRAKVWSDTIVNRLTVAKTTLVTSSSAFLGQTMVTV